MHTPLKQADKDILLKMREIDNAIMNNIQSNTSPQKVMLLTEEI